MEITVVGIKDVSTFQDVAALLAAAPQLGLTPTGFVDSGRHLAAYLHGLPTFKELAGPMGGGDDPGGGHKIRYETWEANKLYST